MKSLAFVFGPMLLVQACSGGPDTGRTAAAEMAVAAPVTRTVDVVDNYFGTEIADPYRWLEDQDGEETAEWVGAQNAVTNRYLAAIPRREEIRSRLTELWNFPRYGAPQKAGDRWVYSKNDGLQNQAVLYITDDPAAEGEVLLDPNTLSADGTVALSGAVLSDRGRYLAYSTSASGSDWREWRVLDVSTGEELSDVVRWSKFAGTAWTADEGGFFYQRFSAPEEGQTFEAVNEKPQLCFHALGTDQSSDVVIYERPDQPTWMFSPSVTEDGRYLVIEISAGTDQRNRVAYAELGDGIGPVQPLLMDFDASYGFLGSHENVFYFQTDHSAPRGRVIALDIHKPKPVVVEPEAADMLPDPDAAPDPDAPTPPEWWDTLVPEAGDTLEAAKMVAGRFVLTYLSDASNRVAVHSLDGAFERELALPGTGTVSGFTGKAEDQETYFSFTSFTTPPTILRYDFGQTELAVFRQPQLRFDPEQFVTKTVFLQSEDATRLPMFLVYKKGLVLDGSNPTYLYGYGGFNISLTPTFSVANLVWVEMGGVYAHAILRGGGEYGEAWHKDGMLANKQNVFDDFRAHAEYLIRNDYTSTPKLAIGGRSNGGLLVGAAMTQWPEMFGAAVPEVGVLDMLRYHKFTIGWAWVPEYGSGDDEAMFEVLRAYSPLHNVEAGRSYPSTLVMTGDHDDRVLPGHSYKFAATLQRAQGGSDPILIRVDVKSGHGGGKPTGKLIDEATDRLAFLVNALDMN